jgi:hypothetical protein
MAAAVGAAGQFLRLQLAVAVAAAWAAWAALEPLPWVAPAGYLPPQQMVLAVKA